jgi:hypothetical protein
MQQVLLLICHINRIVSNISNLSEHGPIISVKLFKLTGYEKA